MATAKPPVQSDTTLTISPSSPAVNAGEPFDLLLQISTDQMTFGMQAALRFDPRLVEVVKIEEGDFYKGWAATNGAQTMMVPGKIAPDKEGKLPVVGIALLGQEVAGRGPTGSGTWLVVHARAREGAKGNATFELDSVKVLDTDLVRPVAMAGVKTVAGQIAIGGAAEAAATPTAVAVAPPTPVRGSVKTAATPAPVNTVEALAAAGALEAAALPAGQPEPDQSGLPWDVIVPVSGVLLVGAVLAIGLIRR
jgi:hypothetical protein